MITKEKVIGTAATLAAIAVLYVFAMPSYRQGEPSIAGRKAPDFEFEMDGKPMHLSDLKGKVVLVDFWASWCPPCVEEAASLNALQQRMASRGGLVLAISQDEDPAAYQKFLTEHKIVFPTYRDPSKKVPTEYGTSIIPEAYLVSRDGKIARKIVGQQDWTSPEIASAIDTVLQTN